jgi:hypothetical protein
MNQRNCFLRIAGGGEETGMYMFISKLLHSVESGEYNNIGGSHYSIFRDNNKIHATTTTHPRNHREYSWEVPE